ncbi:MAG: hypothetical protein IKG21_09460 [Atopobiaceae bacterium]|nr:hypothetical protein [Atopobiaceae bacterium]
MPSAQREYRDRLFTFIFGSKEHRDWTLSLYNAVNNTHYTEPERIAITTIREVLYLGMHNDVSFLVANGMSLYEQQSTYCPNMPLRMLQYAGNLYERHVHERHMNKYGHKLLSLPAPKLVVFYNGQSEAAEEEVLRLSDSFPEGARADIEVRVRMININPGMGEQIKAACVPLREYTWLVEEIRRNAEDVDVLLAIDKALAAMPADFEILPYLLAHKAEVRDMLLTEYDEAEAMELFREEGREEGRDQTILEVAASLIGELGYTADKAMEFLRVPKAERSRYLSML